MLAFKAWKLPGTFLMIEPKFVMKLTALHILFPLSVAISILLFPTLGQPRELQGCFLTATDAATVAVAFATAISSLHCQLRVLHDDHKKAGKDWEKL